jgi:hypothetical protein
MGGESYDYPTCLISTMVDQVRVAAAATDTPGLVVTPRFDRQVGLTGGWVVTHAATGLGLSLGGTAYPDGGYDFQTAQRVAAELGKLPVDWANPDRDAVAAFAMAHPEAIRAAFHDGEFPPPPQADPSDPTQMEPDLYPRIEAQATAAGIARYLIKSAQDHLPAGKSVLMSTEAALAEALRALARVDVQAADATALTIWQMWNDGVSDGYVWILAREYGLPKPEDAQAVIP